MRHALPIAPQFYVTASQPCPYLDGKIERKLFTALHGDHAGLLNDALSSQGFRRSQNVLYRPSCQACSACLSARIRVADFTPSKSQRRIAKRNNHLTRHVTTPWATEDQFELFRHYLNARHADGGMADMDIMEFTAMIEETPVSSRVIEYRRNVEGSFRTELSAVCLTDVLQDGLSMVYSFFEPDTQSNSPGTNIILDHIDIARTAGLSYVYLGFWVPGSTKMGYKANFTGLEVFHDGTWQDMKDRADYADCHRQGPKTPIAEQVNAIVLPDGAQR